MFLLFTGTQFISAIDVYVTNKFIQGTYNSCKDVSVPSTGQLALDIMCGEYGAAKCTPMRWFHYMGDAANNAFVPFQITYVNTSGPVGNFTPMDPLITPCSKAVDVSDCGIFLFILIKGSSLKHCGCTCESPCNSGSSWTLVLQDKSPACSCVDCEASCPAPAPAPPIEPPFEIMGFDGYEFVMAIVFIIGSCLFLIGVFCCSGSTAGEWHF